MIVTNIRSAVSFKQTVLIIDDQAVPLNIHKAIVQSLNPKLNVVTMTDPIEALAWAKNKQLDLIVTDFNMGHMNGMEFVRTFRTKNASLAPIIVITVVEDTHLHKALLASGASACLTKPANPSNLGKVACFLLDESKHFYHDKQLITN